MIDSHAALTEIMAAIAAVEDTPWDTVRALESSGDQSLVPRVQQALESYLDEDNHYGRDVMCSLLAGIVGVRAFPLVLRAFARPTRDDNDSLMGMLRGLIKTDREACRSVILTFALERHRDLRIAGLRALGHAIAPADYDLLKAAADDPDPDVRRAALGSMSSLKGDPRVLATLVVALGDSDPWTRRSAMLHIAYIDGPGPLQHILACVIDPSPIVRRTLGSAIGSAAQRYGGQPNEPRAIHDGASGDIDVADDDVMVAALAALLTLVTDEIGTVRESAIEGLAMFGGQVAIDTLVLHAHDPDARVREMVTVKLSLLAGLGSLATLRSLAADASPHVREAVAEALGRLGVPETAPTLVALLADPKPHVRIQAAHALGNLGDPDSLPLLQRLAVEDPERGVRRQVQAILTHLS